MFGALGLNESRTFERNFLVRDSLNTESIMHASYSESKCDCFPSADPQPWNFPKRREDTGNAEAIEAEPLQKFEKQ